MESLTPDQQVVKIVSDELTALMGESNVALPLRVEAADDRADGRPAGLRQDDVRREAGALLRRTRAATPMLVAADLHRPAAVEQLAVLGQQVGVPVYREEGRRTRSASRAAASRRPAAPAATW